MMDDISDEELARKLIAIGALPADDADPADFSPEREMTLDASEISAVRPGLQLRDKSANVVGDRDLSAGLRDSSVRKIPEIEDDESDGVQSPEPDRPQFGPVPTTNRDRMNKQRGERGEKSKIETEEIKKLLGSFEGAQDKQRRNKKGARRSAYALNAGEAVSSAFANRPMHYVDVPDKYDEAKGMKEKIELGDKLGNTQKKYEDQDLDRYLLEYAGDERNDTSKENARLSQAGQNQRLEQKQNFDWKKTGFTESQKNARAEADRKADLIRGAWQQNASAGRSVGREGAKEVYDQSRMENKAIPKLGKSYQARGPVTAHMSNNADERLESYAMLKPALDQAMALLEEDPRGEMFWGSVARAKLDSALYQAFDADSKFRGNGVLNGKDLEVSQRTLGDAATFEQFIAANGIERIKQYAETLDEQLDAAMASSGYDPGTGRKRSPEEIDRAARGAGGSSTVPVTPADLDAAFEATKPGGKAPASGGGVPNIPMSGEPNTNKPKRRVLRGGKMYLE